MYIHTCVCTCVHTFTYLYLIHINILSLSFSCLPFWSTRLKSILSISKEAEVKYEKVKVTYVTEIPTRLSGNVFWLFYLQKIALSSLLWVKLVRLKSVLFWRFQYLTKAVYYKRNSYKNQSFIKTTHQAVFVFFIFGILPTVNKWENVTLQWQVTAVMHGYQRQS